MASQLECKREASLSKNKGTSRRSASPPFTNMASEISPPPHTELVSQVQLVARLLSTLINSSYSSNNNGTSYDGSSGCGLV